MRIKKNKTICFDIDGVICDTKNNNYKNSKPIVKNIKFINMLYSKGYYIKLFTARFMGRTNDNKVLAKKKAKVSLRVVLPALPVIPMTVPLYNSLFFLAITDKISKIDLTYKILLFFL